MENAILAAKAALYRQDILKNGNIEVTVTGNSMYPFLKNKDIVVLSGISLNEIKIGDIILTYDGIRMLCHRVFRVNKKIVQTKADAFILPDLPICEKNLIGKVIIRKSGKKFIRMDTPFSMYRGFLISMIMVIGAFFYIPARFLRRILRSVSSFLLRK